MRISDWSSDVCSSDLREIGALVGQHQFRLELPAVCQHHLDLAGALDDVLVGDDEALPRDDDAGAERRLLALAALEIDEAVAEEAVEVGIVGKRRGDRLIDIERGEGGAQRRRRACNYKEEKRGGGK